MAHRIETYDKHEATAQAWHGLSVIVPQITLENCWLNQWELVSRELQFADGQKAGFNLLGVSDVPALNIGTPYNPESFKPIDNKAFLELVRASIGGTGHKIVSVGSVRNRGRVFVSIELGGMEKFSAAGREFSAYLNFGNGHDKSSVLWVNTSNTCTVCDNTFGMNLFSVENKRNDAQGDDIKMRVRHTKNADLKLPALAVLIDKAIGVQAEFQLEMSRLADIAIEANNASRLFAGFVGRKVVAADMDKGLSTRAFNTAARLDELFTSGKGNKGRDLADAFSAVTDYYSHESSGKASKGNDNRLKQLVSSEYGAGMVAKSEFWQIVRNDETRELTIDRGAKLLEHTTHETN